MPIKKTIKRLFNDQYDDLKIARLRSYEKRKFQDPRRKNIYSQQQLTIEQIKQIDELYVNNYGRKIPYIWHQHYTAFTGHFDAAYFPELLYIPEFEHFMNQRPAYAVTLGDKNLTALLSKALQITTPSVFLSSTKGVIRDSNYRQITSIDAYEIIKNIGEVFCKPSIDSNSGAGCRICFFKNGYDTITGESVEKVFSSLGGSFIIQERIKCFKKISDIYSESVNTFRIITWRWKDSIRSTPVIMRIGRGGKYLDNAHAGGIFIGIDDDGFLCDTAFTEFNDSFHKHPDSEIRFSGYRIPEYSSAVMAAKRMHEAIPDLGVINFDFTLDSQGTPVLIEMNTVTGSIWLPQIAHGRGAFGEDTPDILHWLKHMETLPQSQREFYAFGKNL